MNDMATPIMVLISGASVLCLALHYRRERRVTRWATLILCVGAIAFALARVVGYTMPAPVPDFVQLGALLAGLVLSFTGIWLMCRPRPGHGTGASV